MDRSLDRKHVWRLAALAVLYVWPVLTQAFEEPSWNKLLRASNADTQTEWGQRYEHGEGVSQDYVKAVRLYCAAARRKHVVAQYQLGWLYANGRGVARDDALAAAWFRLAAKQGDVYARRMLEQFAQGTKQRARCVLPENTEVADPRWAGRDSPARRQVKEWVYDLAPAYGLDADLVLAVIQAESGFNSRARSPKNAQGLMQLIPATAERFGVTDIMDPIQNLHGGMAYLRWLLAFFQGDVRLALAGYNAGEKAVERYKGVPPYAETRAYVAKITRSYRHAYHPPVSQVVKPSAILASLAYERTDTSVNAPARDSGS